jgi:MOSC domain-containing protein YiiM
MRWAGLAHFLKRVMVAEATEVRSSLVVIERTRDTVTDVNAMSSLLSVHVGRVAPLGPEQVPSGFVKHPVAGPVFVSQTGLAGDEQADLEAHGGPDKAVYGYAAGHYPAWARQFPALADKFVPGSMGENLCIRGMDETGLCVGDVHAMGTSLLQLCQPRRPCFKLGLSFAEEELPQAMLRNGFSGWYYRVLRTGHLAPGDRVTLQERPNPDFAFTRLVEITTHGRATEQELRRMAQMPGLASQWRARAQQMLA